MNTLIKAIVLGSLSLCSSVAVATPDVLLSRNATYRLVGAGYCYPGQVQPGVNVRMQEVAFVYSPLVEQTDAGDLLIDGDTDGQTMVHTPWSWSSQWKIIVIEMTLPGPSKVSRVDVYLPDAVDYRPLVAAEAARRT